MIKINTQSLKIPVEMLEEKYSNDFKNALNVIEGDRDSGKIGFIDVDKTIDLGAIEKIVAEKKERFKNVVVLGIGGSALGTLAIHQAIKGKNWNLLSSKQREGFLKLFIIDNVDPKKIQDTLDVINLEETLFIVISKSGNTIETKSLFNFFKEEVEKGVQSKLEDHFIVVAGENSDFKRKYDEKGYTTLGLQDNIGGRFSVLTNVGLLPLALCGIDVSELMFGVTKSKKHLLSDDIYKNPALLSALIHQYSYRELGKNIQVFFPYIDALFGFGEWYKQLVGESLGKGGSGVTTTTSIGVTDQHSQLQLYFDGPNDKLLIFVETKDFGVDYSIGKYSFGDLMKYEKYGTQKAVTDYNKLNYTFTLAKIDEKTIGEFILLLEIQTAIIGELSGVNTYNQPGVEIGKRITKMKMKEIYGKAVVTIGGGNGHSNILAGIKNEFMDKIDLKAIVSMSDDGRTTGKLMRAFKTDLNIDFPPPGDLRRCLYFMSNSSHKENIEKYFETVFSIEIPVNELSVSEMFKIIGIRGRLLQEFIELSGKDFLSFKLPLTSSIKGFKLGNILMGVLYYNYNLDYNRVMDFMHNLLKVEAQVIPVTTDSALIEVELKNGETVQTQDAISNGADYNSPIKEVRLMEESKEAIHNVDIETSLHDADFIIISPGDLYTSNISNLIIGGMKKIITETSAKIIFIGNTTNKGGETQGFTLVRFVEELEKYLGRQIDYFVVNNKKLVLRGEELEKFKNSISVKGGEYIFLSGDDKVLLKKQGTEVVEEDLLDRESLYKHDNKKLAKVLKKIIL